MQTQRKAYTMFTADMKFAADLTKDFLGNVLMSRGKSFHSLAPEYDKDTFLYSVRGKGRKISLQFLVCCFVCFIQNNL